ncbi:tripartite motif-containing protein 2/3 [Pelomyxa schiedti]|nr:tripartite motif-containing protein 2/3 [Pelomyxa schiedti]
MGEGGPFDGVPRRLDCLHSFCTGCLRGLIAAPPRGGGGPGCTTTTAAASSESNNNKSKNKGSEEKGGAECPLCGLVTPIPDCGLRGFLVDFHIVRQIEVSQPMCNQCEKKNKQIPGIAWCPQCAKFMCKEHKTFHDGFMEDHITVPAGNKPEGEGKIVPQNNKPIFCENHPDQELTFLCSCKKIICRDCAILSHRSCTQPVVALEAVKENLSEIEQLTKNIKSRIPEVNEGISSLERTLALVDENAKKTKKEIEMHMSLLHEAVNNRHLALNKEVEELSSQKIAALVAQKERISMVGIQMTQATKVADTLTEWSPVEVLLTQTKIKECANHLLQFPSSSMVPVVDPEITFFGNLRASSSTEKGEHDDIPSSQKGHNTVMCIGCDGVVSSGVCPEKCKVVGTEQLFRIGVTSEIELVPFDNVGNPCSPIDPVISAVPSSCNISVKRKAAFSDSSSSAAASQPAAAEPSSALSLPTPVSFIISVAPTESGKHHVSISFGSAQCLKVEFRAHARACATNSKLTALCNRLSYPTDFVVGDNANKGTPCAEISLVDADGEPYSHGDVTPVLTAWLVTQRGDKIPLSTHLSQGARPGVLSVALGVDLQQQQTITAGNVEVQAALTDGNLTGSPLRGMPVWKGPSATKSTLVVQLANTTKATATLQLRDASGANMTAEAIEAMQVSVTATCTVANKPVTAKVAADTASGGSFAVECGPFTEFGEATVVVQVASPIGVEGSDSPPSFTVSARAAIQRDLSWMETTDQCRGFRQCTYNPRVRFAVAKDTTWDKDRVYDCPPGYHWASTAEGKAIFTSSSQNTVYAYYGQGGWSGYEWGGKTRYYFRFSDSKQTNAYKHAGNHEEYLVGENGETSTFAGIVCITDT